MEVNHEDIYTTLYTRVQVAAQPEHDPVPAPRPWAVDTWYYVEHVSSSSQQLPVSLERLQVSTQGRTVPPLTLGVVGKNTFLQHTQLDIVSPRNKSL